jgi:RimJ/RimL family protein N-acetyltransferase
MRLTSQRMTLRSWTTADRQPFAEMSEDPEVMEYLRPLATRAACDAWIDFQVNHELSHGFCMWATELNQSHEFVGAVGLLRVGFVAHFTPAVEIGWRISRKHWGRGLATEAAHAALQFGFQEAQISKIVAHAGVSNTRSHHVMEKLGMVHSCADDFDHPRLPENDPLRRQVLYRLSRHTWLAQRRERRLA